MNSITEGSSRIRISTDQLKMKTKDITMFVGDFSLKLAEAVEETSQTIEEHGNVDVLINNAGIIQPFITLADLELDRIQRVININLYRTIFMIKAFLAQTLVKT